MLAPQGKTWQAIGLMILSMASFAVMNIFIRYASHDMHTTQIVFLRNLFATLFFIPYIAHIGTAQLRTQRISRHIWRAGIGIISMELWFMSLAIMPLTDATALSFTSPLWATLMAVFFLKEKIGIHRILALCTGFAGAMLIVRPSASLSVEPASAIVLVSALFMAMASTMVKSLTATDAPWRIVFYMSLFMTLFSFPLALWHWQPPTLAQICLIVAVAGTSVIAHLLMVNAFARASLVLLMPFDFMRLIFTAILAHFAFAERLDLFTALGAGIIIASTCYISYREAKRHAPPQPHSEDLHAL